MVWRRLEEARTADHTKDNMLLRSWGVQGEFPRLRFGLVSDDEGAFHSLKITFTIPLDRF